MTLTHRIGIAFVALIAVAAAAVGAGWISYQTARADAADYTIFAAEKPVLIAQADTAPLDAGVAEASPTATSSPTTAAADKLHDPIESPSAAWDDLKASKKVGWSVLVFAVLVMLAKLAGRAKGMLSVLGRGKVPVVVGAVGALAAACYNAAAEGGAWTAMLVSGVVALGHYMDASKTS